MWRPLCPRHAPAAQRTSVTCSDAQGVHGLRQKLRKRLVATPHRCGRILAVRAQARCRSRKALDCHVLLSATQQKTNVKKRGLEMLPQTDPFNPAHYRAVRRPLLEAETMPAW